MDDQKRDFVVSYLTLRQMIGWIGLLMPLTVRILAFALEGVSRDSIIMYYYTGMHDVFVTTLILIGILLTCYRSPALVDNVVSIIAGLSAIGMAFFPAAPESSGPTWNLLHGPAAYHVPFAIAFFALCVCMIFRFVAFTPATPTREKIRRNWVYRICGGVMAVACVLILVLMLMRRPIFWPEAIAIISFAITWLVKGQTFFLKDPKEATVAVPKTVAPATATP